MWGWQAAVTVCDSTALPTISRNPRVTNTGCAMPLTATSTRSSGDGMDDAPLALREASASAAPAVRASVADSAWPPVPRGTRLSARCGVRPSRAHCT